MAGTVSKHLDPIAWHGVCARSTCEIHKYVMYCPQWHLIKPLPQPVIVLVDKIWWTKYVLIYFSGGWGK